MTVFLLTIYVVLFTAMIPHLIQNALQFHEWVNSTRSVKELKQDEGLWNVINIAMTLLYLALTVAFFMWVYRANRVARASGAEGMKFTPGWAVGWFFVPLLNFPQVLRVMRELWLSSAPFSEKDQPKGLRKGPRIVVAWWAFWMLNGVTGIGSGIINTICILNRTKGNEGAYGQSMILSCTSIFTFLVANILLIMVVRQITQRLEARLAAICPPAIISPA